MFNNKKGQLSVIGLLIPMIIPLIIIILLSPAIFGSYKIIGGIMAFFNAPVTGNIPVWVFFVGILLVIIIFKRRERQFVR